jgi:hypothetical protein
MRYPKDVLNGIVLINQWDIESIPIWVAISSEFFKEA